MYMNVCAKLGENAMSVAQWNAGLDATWQPLYVECLSDFKNNNKTKTYGLQKERERERESDTKKNGQNHACKVKAKPGKWARHVAVGGKDGQDDRTLLPVSVKWNTRSTSHTTMASSNGFSSDFPLSSRLWTLDSPKLKWCQGWWVCIATPPIYTHTHSRKTKFGKLQQKSKFGCPAKVEQIQ